MSKSKGRKMKGGKVVDEIKIEESGSESDVEALEEESTKPTNKKATRSNGRLKKEEIGEGDDVSETPVTLTSRSSRKMMFAHKGIGESGWKNMEQVTLIQPRTGHKAVFLIDTQNDSKSKKFFLYEIMTMEHETRSWFLDESVVSDGNLYVSTPIDPLFMVLPLLMKSSHAKPLKDHLIEEIASKRVVDILCYQLLSSSQLENIAVKKVCDDIIAFKYSEENTLKWLSEKVERTLTFLYERDISNTEASISSNFTKTSNGPSNAVQNRETYMWYACEIVGEYLQEQLKKKLFEKFGVPAVQEKNSGTKRKGENDSGISDEGQSKKAKVTADGHIVQPTEDYGSSKNTPVSNASSVNSKTRTKEKELQKAAKGSLSLLKFFAPKAK